MPFLLVVTALDDERFDSLSPRSVKVVDETVTDAGAGLTERHIREDPVSVVHALERLSDVGSVGVLVEVERLLARHTAFQQLWFHGHSTM